MPGTSTPRELAERGVIGFKAFMCNSGIDDFARADDLTLHEGMARAATRAARGGARRERPAPARAGRARPRDDFRPARWWGSSRRRPRHRDAPENGRPLHIVHVSSGRGVALVAEARARGVDVTCETCPHYLFLTR